jgi:hypothetical protein
MSQFKRETLCMIVGALIAIALGVVLFGCVSTIAPSENLPTQTSFVGNDQHAGFLGWSDDGGIAINDAKRSEYNALIDLYGVRVVPPLKHDDGVVAITAWTDSQGKPHTGNAWSLDKEHVVKFALMKSWQHRGDKPASAIEKILR